MVCFGDALSALSRPDKEEENNPGQFADCSLAVCTPLAGDVEGLEDGDRDWADSGRRMVLLHVSCEFSSHEKVNISQLFFPGVAGPHGCKYFPDVTKLLFRGPLLYWDPNSCQKDGGHGLRENLE